MADKQQALILTQLVDSSWTVSVVANLEQGVKRAGNMAAEATVKQCVAVPITLAALAPKMKDMLSGHADIDAMMTEVETGEAPVSNPNACQRCGVPHAPEGLVKLINQYLTLVAEPITRSHGVIDKFIGDAVVAYWGPPFADAAEHAEIACRAALDQMVQVERLNRPVRPRSPVRILCTSSTGRRRPCRLQCCCRRNP